jgi:2-methylcitrate dehydratase
VTVTHKDGHTLTAQIQHPKGHPANPLSPVTMEEKFEDCAFGVLERPDIRQLIELVRGLEHVADIGTLMDVLMT